MDVNLHQSVLNHEGCRNTDPLLFRRYTDGEDDAMIGLSCNTCLSEWVLPEHSTFTCIKEVMEISGQTFLYIDSSKRWDIEAQPDRREIRDPKNVNEYLKTGDHITYKWISVLKHHAIVEKVDKEKVTVIHWQGRGVVREELDLREKSYIAKMLYNDESVVSDSMTLTLARARAWVGEKGYNPVNKNCEHFAIFCKIGAHKSWQVAFISTAVLDILGAVSAEFVRGVALDLVGDLIEVVGVNESQLLTVQTQLIGMGLVVVVQGAAFIIDITRLYDKRAKGEITEKEFTCQVWHSLFKRLEKVCLVGVIPAVTALALAPLGAIVALGVGALVGGLLIMPWIENPNLSTGCVLVSHAVRPILDHSDVKINTIEELSPGDQVVAPAWLLHPRCHMIVTELDGDVNKMRVVRFTFTLGVVEEWLKITKPLFKVLYKADDCYPPQEVIKRARTKRDSNNLTYSIIENNCKDFARWCKTGNLPWSILPVKGYE